MPLLTKNVSGSKSERSTAKKYKRYYKNFSPLASPIFLIYNICSQKNIHLRKTLWDNRKGMIGKDGFASSIRNRGDVHVRLHEEYCKK